MDTFDPTGRYYWRVAPLKNKYNLKVDEQVFEKNIDRLTNQLWKLIPMRENNEKWREHLDSVLLQIIGLENLFIDVNFLKLISKLEGLRSAETDFEFYRKTVFESISLLRRVEND